MTVYFYTVELEELWGKRKQFIKKEYIPIHVLVLQYTRVFFLLQRWFVNFSTFFQKQNEKIKEHKDITNERINLKKWCHTCPILFFIIKFAKAFSSGFITDYNLSPAFLHE